MSAQGVAQRDAAVWQWAQRLQAPIAMLLSGGYTRASAGVISDSIAGLLRDLSDKYGGGSSISSSGRSGERQTARPPGVAQAE